MGVRRTIYKSLLSSLIVVLTPFLVLVGSMAQDSSFATQALAVDLADISWGPPGGGNGVPDGRSYRQTGY